ncbi:MAG TPA: 2OG-Fe(II) oxygenase [Vicinamibacterales bacterium]|nr:2OG-Fe(II) oxygenase [Vicinamibacterales bacterium]
MTARASAMSGAEAVADVFVDGIASIDWAAIGTTLDEHGFAALPALLSADECHQLAELYEDDSLFRSRIEMERFRFGVGEYKYFAAPLPPRIQTLRTELYRRLVPIANRWTERLGSSQRFPETLERFLKRCHDAGQTRPTPLLLTYETGGYNCLHQDIYGDVAFPLQVVFVLSRHDVDYRGGEFLLVEQRPRAQSRGYSVTIERGAGLVWATRERPVSGSRGTYRVVMRHGVSTITSGSRRSLGIIFHDAK